MFPKDRLVLGFIKCMLFKYISIFIDISIYKISNLQEEERESELSADVQQSGRHRF